MPAPDAASLLAQALGASIPRDKRPRDDAESYRTAVGSHPFVHRAQYRTIVTDSATIVDGQGNIVALFFRGAVPPKAAAMAAKVLTPAATRTSLRAAIFGGEAPQSGIAGYFDYAGSPIEYKCRKTSFTCDALAAWPAVYPVVEYANELYRAALPQHWAAQHGAVPDPVRIHGTVFSTLTINQRFRTAAHTDAGDFDGGYGLITALDGDYDGLYLGFPKHRVAVCMGVGDVLIFNTHHYHANTELERLPGPSGSVAWSRLTCVMYYRANLGEPACLREYRRRLDEARVVVAAVDAGEIIPRDPKAKKKKTASRKADDGTSDDDDDDDDDEESASDTDSDATDGAATESEDEAPTAAEVAEMRAALQRFPDGVAANHNGVNLNKAATVFRRRTTPLALYTAAFRCRGAPLWEAAVRVVDGSLQGTRGLPAADVDALSRALFGEPAAFGHDWAEAEEGPEQLLTRAFSADPAAADCGPGPGVALRPEALLAEVDLRSGDTVHLNAPRTGGFSETGGVKQIGADSHRLLADESLAAALPEELCGMWRESRQKWLELVQRDWQRLRQRNAERTDFSWANKSDMNAAFFDLCEVGSGVLLSLLGKDEATAQEKGRFWVAFATHLHLATIDELEMPPTAMSLRKLNVKLKDFTFGGTRYFKDFPVEEQERRRKRRQRIEEARQERAAAGIGNTETQATWLDNDRFDYQCEEAAVDFEALGLPEPVPNAQRLTAAVADAAAVAGDAAAVLVVRCGGGAVTPTLVARLSEACGLRDGAGVAAPLLAETVRRRAAVLRHMSLVGWRVPPGVDLARASVEPTEEDIAALGDAATAALQEDLRATEAAVAQLPAALAPGAVFDKAGVTVTAVDEAGLAALPPTKAFDLVLLHGAALATSDVVTAARAVVRGPGGSGVVAVEPTTEDRQRCMLPPDARAAADDAALAAVPAVYALRRGVALDTAALATVYGAGQRKPLAAALGVGLDAVVGVHQFHRSATNAVAVLL